MLSHFSHGLLFATLWTVASHAPLSSGFSRQEYWSGLPCPPPGESSRPGDCLLSLLHWQTSSLALVPPGKPLLQGGGQLNREKKKETSFRRGHGPKKNKAFISTIVFSSIIKAAWICYRKSRETHRKLKHPWSLKNYHFYDNSNLFLLYIPTCPHTHTHTNLYDS